MKKSYLIGFAVAAGISALAFAVPQTRFLLIGFPEERLQGGETALRDDQKHADQNSMDSRLLEVGLSVTPLLGDTGVSGHMARLEAGEVTKDTLEQYADDLAALSKTTAELGQAIPAAFWDVDTEQLRQDGWTSYRIVAALNSAKGAPFVTALGSTYARFHRFKTQPKDGNDTALDTALDLFAPVIALLETESPDGLLETSPYITSPEQAALYLWQDVVSGSSRRNPLTRQKIFDHGFASRFHVGTIWQYETGAAQSGSDIWGVSGFAPEFVGPPENNNQIEHLSISMVVQGLLREPLLVLDAFEEMEWFIGSASAAETAADEALNRAIREIFIPGFERSLPEAIEALRRHLHKP